MGFPDVVEGKDAGRSGVELAVLHLFGDVAQWYVRQRETRCAEYKAAEKSQMHAAGHPQQWIEVRYGCESTQPACQARAPAAPQHIQGVEDRAVAHQVEDGIDLLGLGDARGQIRRLDLGACRPERREHCEVVGIATGGDNAGAAANGEFDRGLAERRGGPAYDDGLASSQLEVAEQACPSGGIGFGNCRQLRPRQVGVDEGDVGCADTGVFGVASIDSSAETTHQCRNGGANRKFTSGTRVDDTDAFDAADLGGFGPFAPTHVHFSVVDAERLDRYHDFAVSWSRLGNLGVDQTV